MFCETRKLAEEWVYRYLAAALVWAEPQATALPAAAAPRVDAAAGAAGDGDQPSPADVRNWARLNGIEVSDRGRLRPEVIAAWHDAHRC